MPAFTLVVADGDISGVLSKMSAAAGRLRQLRPLLPGLTSH